MKTRFIGIISLLAILSLVPLQWLWLSHSYRVWENDIYQATDASFKVAYENELINRVNDITPPEGTKISIPNLKSDNAISSFEYIGFNDFANKFHHPRNYKNLRKIFDKELAKKAIYGLDYKIITLKTDTTYYKNASSFFNDTTVKNISFHTIKTHIIPIRYDLTEGIQLVAINPYKIILSKMQLILIVSFLIILIILTSLVALFVLLKKLRNVAKIRQDYTYDIIHNMGTPLSIAKSIDESLLARYPTSKQINKENDNLQKLKQAIDHIDYMCGQVLTVAKIEQHRMRINKQEVDINKFLQHIINDRIIESMQGKEVTYIYNDAKGMISAEISFLEQTINNLIDNSIKYSGNSVKMQFSTYQKRKYTELAISDNGYGISESEQKDIFQLYSRGSNTHNKKGHGIGLHFVALVMKVQKGYVKINSEINKGTIVTLGFPLK